MSVNKYLLDKNDFEAYKDLFFYSFDVPENESESTFLKREFEKSAVYGIKSEDQLMASITCVPFKVNFFGKPFKMEGIANVMSAPEYAKNNGINTLMKQAFKEMFLNNVTLSYLGPFSYDYYRRFGYEQVFKYLKIEMPFDKLTRYKKPLTGRVRRFKYEQAPEIIGDIFEKNNTAGTVIRKPWWWKNISLWFPDHKLAVSYDKTNQINGYMRYFFKDDKFIIHDLFYQSPEAFINLMHFINKHRSIYKTIVINSSDVNSKVNNFATNPSDATVTVVPSMMARIVELKGFMFDYPLQVENLEPINVKVTDSLEWNNHLWKFGIKSGDVCFAKNDQATPDVTVDIQTLTKAMFGYQSLSESFMVGDVSGDFEKVQEIDRAFVHENAQLKDFF